MITEPVYTLALRTACCRYAAGPLRVDVRANVIHLNSNRGLNLELYIISICVHEFIHSFICRLFAGITPVGIFSRTVGT